MKKLVVYSCLTRGYDLPADPSAVSPDVDYVLFTDAAIDSKVWQLRPFDKATGGFSSSLTARWHKLNPETLFPDYEYCLWVDANVLIASDTFYERLRELCDNQVLWAGIAHPDRDDTIDEGEAVLHFGRESLLPLIRMVRIVKRAGLPRHSGLMETNVVLRKHSDPAVSAFDALWWRMVSSVTYRDQMSVMYALRECGITPELMIPKGSSTRNHEFFRYIGGGHCKPYVKSRSLGGILYDAKVAARCLLYRILVLL